MFARRKIILSWAEVSIFEITGKNIKVMSSYKIFVV